MSRFVEIMFYRLTKYAGINRFIVRKLLNKRNKRLERHSSLRSQPLTHANLSNTHDNRYIVRKLPDKRLERHMDIVFAGLGAHGGPTPELVDGLAHLVFEATRHVQNQLHSKTPALLSVCFDKLSTGVVVGDATAAMSDDDEDERATRADALEEVVTEALGMMVCHSVSLMQISFSLISLMALLHIFSSHLFDDCTCVLVFHRNEVLLTFF
jgi:hypothetical protein